MSAPTLEEWRRLYEAAIRFKETKPWEWMEETDVFGVQNPETGQIGYVSITGMLGEHLALTLYLGTRGLAMFRKLLVTDFPSQLEASIALLEIPMLQASFENRNQLHKKDREVIKALGLKFRGRHAWPLFRSYRPGYAPWFLTAEEARFLTWGIEQGLEVALSVRENPSMLIPEEEGTYLVRVPRREGDTIVWENRWLRPPREEEAFEIEYPGDLLDYLSSIPKRKMQLQVDLFLMPIPIREKKGQRPYYPYMLLMVDARSGFVLGFEMMEPGSSLAEMLGKIPELVLSKLAAVQVLPQTIIVRSQPLEAVLSLIAEDLGLKIIRSQKLGALDRAKTDLFARFVR